MGLSPTVHASLRWTHTFRYLSGYSAHRVLCWAPIRPEWPETDDAGDADPRRGVSEPKGLVDSGAFLLQRTNSISQFNQGSDVMLTQYGVFPVNSFGAPEKSRSFFWFAQIDITVTQGNLSVRQGGTGAS